MSEKKKQFISVRFDDDEKVLLESRARKECMSLSQYIRYIMLEGSDKAYKEEEGLRSDDHIKKMTRCILSMRHYVFAMAENMLDDGKLEELHATVGELFKRYNIYEEIKKEHEE
jgi:hypothetical protein